MGAIFPFFFLVNCHLCSHCYCGLQDTFFIKFSFYVLIGMIYFPPLIMCVFRENLTLLVFFFGQETGYLVSLVIIFLRDNETIFIFFVGNDLFCIPSYDQF